MVLHILRRFGALDESKGEGVRRGYGSKGLTRRGRWGNIRTEANNALGIHAVGVSCEPRLLAFGVVHGVPAKLFRAAHRARDRKRD